MNAMPNILDLPDSEPGGRPEDQLSTSRNQAGGRPDLERFLEDFVSGREPQTTQWIRLASLVASQSFSCDVVIRVLRPNEKSASGTLPIDKLGISIARKVGAKYSPGRLKRMGARMEDVVVASNPPGGGLEQYSFDKSFLPATARVLVIGDHEPPAPTFEAIRAAIEGQLPNAEVKSFTLYWLEEHFRSAPLDDRYFLSSESPLSVLSRQANPHRSAVPQDPLPAEPGGVVAPIVFEPPPLLESPAEPVHVPDPVTPPRGVAAVQSKDRKAAPSARPIQKKIKRVPSWVALVALGVIVLGVGLFVVGQKKGLFSSRFAGSDASVIPEPAEALMVEPATVEAAPVSVPVVESKPKGPQGIITVPSAGLRAGPSLDAKALRKAVRGNERVTILKRRPSNSGPDWVQIETKTGTVGWVWASVVRETRRK